MLYNKIQNTSITKNISVVVQGPIDDKTYECLEAYKHFKEIIFSTWVNQPKKYIDKIYQNIPIQHQYEQIIIAQNEYPRNIKQYANFGSAYYIAQTLLCGANLSTGQYVLKVRSDELYPDLSILLMNLSKHPDKLHTTNNGFWKNIDYCLSNHLILEQKIILIKACQLIIDYLSNQNNNLYLRSNICEQIFGYFLMLARDHNLTKDNWKSIFKDNVFITPCHELPNHLHSGQTSYTDGFTRRSDYPNNRSGVSHKLNMLYNNIEEII